jgi:general secretion pathway protein H
MTPRCKTAGLTLVEIMIVILIMALAMTGIVMAFNSINRTKVRSAAMRIMAASRFAYSRAVTQGKTVRVVLDLDEGRMGLQEAHGRVTLVRIDDPRRQINEEGEEVAVDPWEAARAQLEETLQPSFGASPFGPITGRGGEALDRYRLQDLGSGVHVVRLVTPHEPSPREEGRGAVYYFPGGTGEHAVIWLSDGGDDVYTVELHGLTGRGTVYNRAYEPEVLPEDTEEEDRREVEDPL